MVVSVAPAKVCDIDAPLWMGSRVNVCEPVQLTDVEKMAARTLTVKDFVPSALWLMTIELLATVPLYIAYLSEELNEYTVVSLITTVTGPV